MSRQMGRRVPKNAPRLNFSQFWTGAVPDHPSSVDYLAKLSAWQMLGNDYFGDCVAVMAANYYRLVSATLGIEVYPTQDDVFALYKTQNPGFVPNPQNPGEDNGMDMQTMLEYWQKNQWAGTQLVAFASLDIKTLDALKAAIAVFGGICPGIIVSQANENSFNAGQPWDYSSRSRQLGGHAVLAGGYAASTSSDVRFITWAKETSFTDAFVAHQWEECWLPILPQHLGSKSFQQGVDINALAKAYQDLTGQPLPIPAPLPPPPTPNPNPNPPPVAGGPWKIASQSANQILLTNN